MFQALKPELIGLTSKLDQPKAKLVIPNFKLVTPKAIFVDQLKVSLLKR